MAESVDLDDPGHGDVGTRSATDDAARPQEEQLMGKVSMHGTITCQEGKGDEMEAVLASMVEAADDEPGTEVYAYFRGEGDTFLFFALMADEESMQQHGQSPAMKAAMQAFMPLMAAPPQVSRATPIAAIGLDV